MTGDCRLLVVVVEAFGVVVVLGTVGVDGVVAGVDVDGGGGGGLGGAASQRVLCILRLGL